MKILITGSKGFIGKHLVKLLKQNNYDVLEYEVNDNEQTLIKFIKECDFIIHLAGINRPLNKKEFYDGNANFTYHLVELIKKENKIVPIIMSSSIQAELDNDYGKSKKIGEDILFNSNLPVYIYRLSNVFGKWCKPNYNSVAATFCFNIAHDLPITINDKNHIVHFNYVDDICYSFLKVLKSKNYIGNKKTLTVEPIYDCSLSNLADFLYYFKQSIESDRHLPLIHSDFELKLFKTFCDYLNDNKYPLNESKDNRGSFEELYKSEKYGQISENISYPNITKGGHYHTYKKEIFYVVKGKCKIIQQNINNTKDIIKDIVSDKDLKIIDIKPNYTHQITNIGNTNSHTLMWISHIYNPNDTDTYKKDLVE